MFDMLMDDARKLVRSIDSPVPHFNTAEAEDFVARAKTTISALQARSSEFTAAFRAEAGISSMASDLDAVYKVVRHDLLVQRAGRVVELASKELLEVLKLQMRESAGDVAPSAGTRTNHPPEIWLVQGIAIRCGHGTGAEGVGTYGR